MNTKNRILQTALKLFVENGAEKTSMNQIADVLGISKPAIYYHFKSKAILEEGVVDYFDEEMGKWSKNHFRDCATPKDEIREFFKSIEIFNEVLPVILTELPKNPKFSFNEIILQISKKNIKVKNKFEQIFIKSRKVLTVMIQKAQSENQVRKDLDPDLLALHIHSIVEGAGLISSLDESVNLNKIGDELFDQFWSMIKV